MRSLFESIIVEGENLKAKVPKKGWRTIVSVNGISADRIKALAMEAAPQDWESKLAALLPEVMAMTDAPLEGDVSVVVADVSGETETITIAVPTVDTEALKKGLTANFAGIMALAKAAGLTEEEVHVLFSTSLVEYDNATAMGGVDLQNAMAGIMGNMMGGMGGMGPEMGGDGQMGGGDCKAQ